MASSDISDASPSGGKRESEAQLPIVMKCCTKCGQSKPETEFYLESKKQRKHPNHRRTQCKRCVIGPLKPRIKNPIPWIDRPGSRDSRNAWRRANYAKNPEKHRSESLGYHHKNRDKILPRRRAYYANNRERIAASALESHKRNYATAREWTKNNPEKVRKYRRDYAKKYPGVHIPHRHKRRARKLGTGFEPIAKGYRERLMAWQKGLCPYCKTDLTNLPRSKQHEDHIIPLSKGGAHKESNLQLTCSNCNQRKHAKHPLDFAAEMGITKNPLLIAI